MANFTAAIALLKKPFDHAYDVASENLRKKIGIIRTENKIRDLHAKIYETQRIKTIWNTERPLSLLSIFHPVSVISSGSDYGVPTKIKSTADFPDNHNIISGTVGQGKSIFLRYLVGAEIKSGNRVPVFLELRNIDTDNLEKCLKIKFFELLSSKVEDDIFEFFAANGKLSFFLDGFDEVDPSKTQKILNDIEALSYKYGFCRILVSSRPDSGCSSLTRFCVNSICEIKEEDLPAFYKKITKNDEFVVKIMAAIKLSPTKIRSLVSTPLLATLLAISYISAQKIPLEFSEFYEELFQILLIRHDGLKLGWKRSRKTNLSDRQIQQIFEAFCFDTRKNKLQFVGFDAACDIAQRSIDACKFNANGDDFIEDISKITCLLVKEGKKMNFVHASVQEFFASRYIKTRTEPVAQNIYAQLLDEKWNFWYEEILFLRQIDSHRLGKYFLHPDMLKTISDYKANGINGVEMVESYLRKMYLLSSDSIENGKLVKRYNIDYSQLLKTYHYFQVNNRAFDFLFQRNYQGSSHWSILFHENPGAIRKNFYEVSVSRGKKFHEEFVKIIQGKFDSMIRECEKMAFDISANETSGDFNTI